MKKLLITILFFGLSLSSYAGSYVCTSTSYFDEEDFTNVYEKSNTGYLDAQSGEVLNVKENEHFLAMSYNSVTDDFAAGVVVAIINKDKMTFIKSMTNAIELSPPVYEAEYRAGKCIYVK
jgi:hypothetical protein